MSVACSFDASSSLAFGSLAQSNLSTIFEVAMLYGRRSFPCAAGVSDSLVFHFVFFILLGFSVSFVVIVALCQKASYFHNTYLQITITKDNYSQPLDFQS